MTLRWAKERPHLSKTRDFDREESERRLKVPYLSIYNYPILLMVVDEAHSHISNLRERYGLERKVLTSNNVRLIEENTFKNHDDLAIRGSTTLGLWDDYSDVAYVNFNSNKNWLPDYQARIAYITMHELMHAGAQKGGIALYSECLNEGITDLWATQVMDQYVLPKMVENWQKDGIQQYPSQSCELGFSNEDVGLIHAIRRDSEKAFMDLSKATLSGDAVEAREIVTELYGPQIARGISYPGLPVSKIMNWIETNKSK